MITATVRYKLPPHIDHDACREALSQDRARIPAGEGLDQQALHLERERLGRGRYQWRTLADAKAFYSGPWLDGSSSGTGRTRRSTSTRCSR